MSHKKLMWRWGGTQGGGHPSIKCSRQRVWSKAPSLMEGWEEQRLHREHRTVLAVDDCDYEARERMEGRYAASPKGTLLCPQPIQEGYQLSV